MAAPRLMLAAPLLLAAAPPTPGTVVDADAPPQDRPFVEAVDRALLDAQFLPLPAASHSRYLARVTVTRARRGSATARVEAAGPQSRLGDWGAAVNVTLPSHKVALHDLIETRLTVALVERATGRIVWQGGALTIGIAPGTATADKLARAAVARFPAHAAQPIAVP